MRSTKGGRRARWWGGFAVSGLIGAIALGACGTPPESADDALASAQAFVSEASAFRFDASIETTYVVDATDVSVGEPAVEGSADPGWPAERPGSTTTDRSTISGAWTTDGWEARIDDGFGRTEVKVLGTMAYSRFEEGEGADWDATEVPPTTREDLVDELRSMRESMEELEEPGFEVPMPDESTDLAASVYLGGAGWGGHGLLDDPSGFLRAIEDMGDPELVASDDGGVTVAAAVAAPADLEEAWGAPLPGGLLELTSAADGTPLALSLDVREGEDSVKVEIRFSEWNQPREITAPDEADIDTTPWIDEEGLAAVTGMTLLRPTAIPEGWELDYVGLLSGEDSPEGCDQVEMHWSPEIVEGDEYSMPDDYLTEYLLPSACAQEADDTPFVVGSFAPTPSRDVYGVVEVLLGDTVVQLDSSLTEEELAAVVASIAPTDVATLGAEVSTTYLLAS